MDLKKGEMELKKGNFKSIEKSLKKLVAGLALGGALILESGCGSYIAIESDRDMSLGRYCWDHHGWYAWEHYYWDHYYWDNKWHHGWDHWNHHGGHHGRHHREHH